MHGVWSCADATMVQAVAPLARIAPADLPTLKPTPRGQLLIVPIQGVLTKHGLTQNYRGSLGTATDEVRRQVEAARSNADIAGVVFLVDSPGGSSAGIVDLTDAVRELSAVKPTVAYVSGVCASAAYHVVSQSREIVASRGSFVGSIGCYLVVVDVSRALNAAGIQVIPITTSPLKVAGLPGTPLTDEQKNSLQKVVDHAQAEFDRSVMAGRRMKPDALAKVRTGEIFPSDVAMQRKLVDRIGTFDSILPTLAAAAVPKRVSSEVLPYTQRPRKLPDSMIFG
jgi:protease-4